LPAPRSIVARSGKFAVFDHLTYGELRGIGFHNMEAAAKGRPNRQG
jgi:hypothetical protein